MKISAKGTIKKAGWSGDLTDLQRLAQRVETILKPTFDARVDEMADTVRSDFPYLSGDELQARIDQRIALNVAKVRPSVQLAYGRHAARHEGTIEEIVDADARDLRGVVLQGGRTYDPSGITITMNPEKIEAEVRADDTAALVAAAAQLDDELERCKPTWVFVRTPLAMAIAAVVWVAAVVWWCVRLAHPVGNVVGFSFIFSMLPLAAVAPFAPEVRNHVFPAFEALDDHGVGTVKTRLHRAGWIVSFLIALISIVPILF